MAITQQNCDSNDYQIEATRIVAIISTVAYHMLVETGVFLTEGQTFIALQLASIWMAVLMFDSGFVHGIKEEFESQGSLNKSTYFAYIKKRFLRLYIGFYLAYTAVFIAKFISNYPMTITPFTLFFDLTNTWGLFFGRTGEIWGAGWFLGALFCLSVLYPFIRRLLSIRITYVYIIITLSFCFIVFFFFTDNHVAYFHPIAWIPEFFGGVLLGRHTASKGTRPKPATTRFQRIIVKMGARTYPIYLAHMIPIVLLSYRPPIWEYILATIGVLILSETFYRLLKLLESLRNKKKG
ncbi:MAG: acyltransferase family protein [Promethearchaeota archaeon]|jgi:peptidoglycan/LPS O-acetylase OafA/YrhL